MRRSVKVIAILQLILSLCLFSIAVSVAMPVAKISGQEPDDVSISLESELMVTFIFLIPALWGLANSIGLLRLRNWARISTILFAVVLGGTSGCLAIMAALFPSLSPSGLAPGEDSRIPMFLDLCGAAQLCIGIWWTISLSLPRVKEEFNRSSAKSS